MPERGVLLKEHSWDLKEGTKISFVPINNDKKNNQSYKVTKSEQHKLLQPFGKKLKTLEKNELAHKLSYKKGFPFDAVGGNKIHHDFWISKNGFITIGIEDLFKSSGIQNSFLTAEATGMGICSNGVTRIFPFIANFESGDVYALENNDRLVITWNKMIKEELIGYHQQTSKAYQYGKNSKDQVNKNQKKSSTFQAALHKDGRIDFIYDKIDDIIPSQEARIGMVGLCKGDHYANYPLRPPIPLNFIQFSTIPTEGIILPAGGIVEEFTEEILQP